MNHKSQLSKAILEWDTVNWGRALRFWEVEKHWTSTPVQVLDIGGRNGGLSLLFATINSKDGTIITCTDLVSPEENAKPLHMEFGVADRITYKALNAVDLDEEEKYDVICFKSVLGAIGYDNNFSSVQYRCYGFLGCLGRTERQRNILGTIDTCLDWLVPRSMRYIISVVAEKQA